MSQSICFNLHFRYKLIRLHMLTLIIECLLQNSIYYRRVAYCKLNNNYLDDLRRSNICSFALLLFLVLLFLFTLLLFCYLCFYGACNRIGLQSFLSLLVFYIDFLSLLYGQLHIMLC